MGNSKRLEKVKKYGERLMTEMKGLADSAKAPLENFKIDLEVETKAAEQLLFRLKDVRAVIAGYEEVLKNIDGRFDQFKALLAGLDRESAAVEENLLRIRDESVFADGVFKKITGARKRFDALKQEIGQFKESILGSFEKTNAETLEKSAASLLSATKETAAALRDEVERKVGALAQTVDAAAESVKSHLELMRKAKEDQETVIENSMKEVNRLAEEAVKKAGECSVEYEDQLFLQLREEAGGKAKAAREKIESDWEAVRQMSDQNNAAISAISREIENAKADVRDTISRTSQEEKALWEERLVAAREDFDLFAESAAELEGRIKALQEQIGGAAQQIETTFNESMENAARDAAENAERFGGEKFNMYQTALEEKFSSFGAASEERINAAREKIESSLEAVRQLSDETSAAISRINEDIENAKADVRDTISCTSQEEQALWEEKLSAARDEFNLRSESVAELESRIKAIQEQIGGEAKQIETTFTESMENAAREAAENAEKHGAEKFHLYRAALEEEISAFGADSDEKLKAAREKIESGWDAIRQASEENSAAISKIRQEIENAKADVRDTVSRASQEEKALWEEKLSAAKGEFGLFAESATELEGRIKALQEQIGGAAQQIETTFTESMENAVKDALENAEKFGGEKFNAYRAALEEKLSAFSTDSDEKLKEASDSVSGMIGSLKGLAQNTENEIRESVAVMKSGTDKAKADVEVLAAELEALKKDATDNLSGRIAQLEKTMTDSLREKIEKLSEAQEAEFTKLDSEIGEKYRAAAEETGGKWTGEFERLKEKLDMFENALRLEMDVAGENLGVYKESLEQNMEDLRNNTELALKTEIGKITLETNERLRSHQREFEDGLKSLSTDVKKRLEGTQASIEENSLKSGEALRAANEKMEATAQKIAALNAEIENAQKEMADFSEQTKLFEQADNLKVELERKIEDMEADIERLTQEKNVLTGMEMQFGKIRRMEEDMNAKLTRFLAEQKRMDIMESNFNRLVKMSGDIEDKLKSISAENDMLEQVQVKLRKLSEAADISEEKYQRVENRNNIIDTTNAGISLNLKKLEDAEHRLEARQADIKNIDKEIAGIKDALSKIKFENGEALEISRALSTLDTSLAEIEGRIEKMETAREWLAGVETRMSELQRNTMENISRIDDKTKKNRDGSRDKVDVLSPSMQEDVRRLKHEGWSVDNIAKNYKLSIGEVQLILEKTQR
jgi:chromosome segregation ATPase